MRNRNMYEIKTKKRVQFREESRSKIKIESADSALERKEFLTFVIELADKHFLDAIRVHSEKPISEVTSLHEISLNIDKLIDCDNASSSTKTVRYALASVYNAHYTALALRKQLLSELEAEGYIKVIKDIDCYAPNIPEKAFFSSACTSLDEQNKELLTKLILNYRGW